MVFESIKGKEGISIFLLCVCISFVFATVSTPIAQFKGRGLRVDGASKISCITYWGYKEDCSLNPYAFYSHNIACSRAKQLFQVSAAFAIISVFVTLGSIFVAVFQILGRPIKVITCALAVFGIITILIPWVCMMAVWHNNYCGGSAVADPIPVGSLLRQRFEISAGLGFFIAAWCLQIIGTICLLIL